MNEALPSESPLYRARPTLRVGGRDEPRASSLVVAMEMREHEGGMSSVELRFSNVASLDDHTAEPAFDDERVLRLGAELRVYCGDVRDPQEIFRGTITATELVLSRGAPAEHVVLAEDALQRARLVRRTRVHPSASIGRLAGEVARAAGLEPIVNRAFDGDIGTQVQLAESDLAFLRRLVRERDGDVQVVEGELHVTPRSDAERSELELAMQRTISSLRITADLAHQATAVTVAGWDAGASERIAVTARGSRLGEGTGRTGPQLLRDALGERSEHVGHVSVRTRAEAQALADAAFDQAARRFVRACGTADGNAALRVGARVRLGRAGRRFRNAFYVTSTCHRFDLARGYETDFEAECAYLGEP
jgi:phage protein D